MFHVTHLLTYRQDGEKRSKDMTRLTKKDLESKLTVLNHYSVYSWEIIYFNGYTHLYRDLGQGRTNVCTGSMRDVYDAMYFILVGMGKY